MLQKIREDMVGGPSIVLTRKAVVDKSFIQNLTNLCQSIVVIDASQLYSYAMCQAMSTGLYTHWDLDTETGKFMQRQNKTCGFENMVKPYFQQTRPECKIESFHTTGRQNEIAYFSVEGFRSHCNTAFQAMGCFYHFCHCRKIRTSLTEEDIRRENLKERTR